MLNNLRPSGGVNYLGPLYVSHDPAAASVNGFTFGSGPMTRVIASPGPGGPWAESILAGGASGDPASPLATHQLGRWLTNRYSPVLFKLGEVYQNLASWQLFVPQR